MFKTGPGSIDRFSVGGVSDDAPPSKLQGPATTATSKFKLNKALPIVLLLKGNELVVIFIFRHLKKKNVTNLIQQKQ